MARGPADIQLKEKAYDELRALLLSGEFPVGSLISERQLVARFQISKTPIRVALERLERDGFVEILPQRGVRVRGLSDKEIVDHFDLRGALETWVVQAIAAAAEEPDWGEVDAVLDEQRAAVEAGDLDRYATADADFHDRLAVLAGNEEIVRIIRLQRERLFRIILRVLAADPSRPAASLEEHRAIVAALAGRDAELAGRRMLDHHAWGRRFLLAAAP